MPELGSILNGVSLVTGAFTLAAFMYGLYAWYADRSKDAETQSLYNLIAGQDQDFAKIMESAKSEHAVAALSQLTNLKKILLEKAQSFDALVTSKEALRVRAKQSAYLGIAMATVAILAALGGVTARRFTIARPFVPPSNPQLASKVVNPPGQFRTVRDVSAFDLRAWVPVPGDKKDERVSPVNYINYLHVTRLTEDATQYVAHYSTSGAAIDIRVITQNAKIERLDTESHPGRKSYQVSIDVRDYPIGEEFLVIIEATYWNGFQKALEDASTYTDSDSTHLTELALIVLFPDARKFQRSRRVWSCGDDAEQPYSGDSKLFEDAGQRYIYWGIRTIKPDCHYRLTWEW
jgi:hypothetical protein